MAFSSSSVTEMQIIMELLWEVLCPGWVLPPPHILEKDNVFLGGTSLFFNSVSTFKEGKWKGLESFMHYFREIKYNSGILLFEQRPPSPTPTPANAALIKMNTKGIKMIKWQAYIYI